MFDTLDDARNGDWKVPIPSKFKLTEESGQMRTIEISNDDSSNEKTNVNEISATQECSSYVFHNDDVRIRLIDTPGIGNKREIEKNFDNILMFANQYQHLNGICILLKPNNTRLRFDMQELLSHLNKSVKNNIVFCFTHTKPTFYRPEDTMGPLGEQLSTLKNQFKVEINLNQDTVYCFDNESIRFLAADKAGVKFEKGYEEFSESWRKSVEESSRLLKYFENCKPHKINDTLLIKDVRDIMMRLAKPLAEIGTRIHANIGFLHDHLKEIENTAETAKNLIDKLYIKQLDFKPEKLQHPRTVCTSASCVQVSTKNGANIINYITHCHKSCGLSGVKSYEKKNPALKNCGAMENNGTCKTCKCNWDTHMHVDHELIPVYTKVIDKNVESAINEKRSFQEQKKMAMEASLRKVAELKEEQKVITDINVKFVQFLKQSTIVPFIDAYIDYLDHFIKEEEIKKNVSPKNFNDAVLKGLEDAKKEYTEKINLIKKSIENNDNSIETISPDDMSKIEQQLNELKHNGEALKDIKEKKEKEKYNQKHIFENQEKHYNFPKKIHPESQEIDQQILTETEKDNVDETKIFTVQQEQEKEKDGEVDETKTFRVKQEYYDKATEIYKSLKTETLLIGLSFIFALIISMSYSN
ncbi:10785_t:CDS:1 [Diversispora eburnea]|uniref:10785_t:CDS:1 n=1 Tax=Diversispora eburnea TaxID=1213867 RepID=A0A9N9AQG4_9GLOM|nr:10785_t:CDS:1 [Diversispora eburnea]